MTIGPIQGLVIGFPDNEMFEGRIAEELARLSDVGQIRVIDAVFVTRDGDEIDVVSVSGLDDEQRAELRAAVGALVGLGWLEKRVPPLWRRRAPRWTSMP